MQKFRKYQHLAPFERFFKRRRKTGSQSIKNTAKTPFLYINVFEKNRKENQVKIRKEVIRLLNKTRRYKKERENKKNC